MSSQEERWAVTVSEKDGSRMGPLSGGGGLNLTSTETGARFGSGLLVGIDRWSLTTIDVLAKVIISCVYLFCSTKQRHCFQQQRLVSVLV